MEIKKIINVISIRYYNGYFLNLADDISQETITSLLENGINPFQADFFVLWKATSKAFYKTIKQFGYSKKLNKTESEICDIFYNISSMTDSDFKILDNIRSLYLNNSYKSVIEYYGLNLNKAENKKLQKFLAICFKKKGAKNENCQSS